MNAIRTSYNYKKKKVLLDVIKEVARSEIDYKRFDEAIMKYDEFTGDRVCKLVATDSRSLKLILKDYPELPDVQSVYHWRMENPSFSEKFHLARCAQAQMVIDEILELADDPANCEPEILNWAKERIKARQWMATRLIPKIYGDKLQTEHSVNESTKEVVKRVADINKEAEKDY